VGFKFLSASLLSTDRLPQKFAVLFCPNIFASKKLLGQIGGFE
jgi:hypothetical protein